MESGASFATLDLEAGERFVALRRQLGVESFGLNLMLLEPGQRGRVHRHERQEEVYIVLEGTLTLELDGGEVHTLQPHDAARVGPETRTPPLQPRRHPRGADRARRRRAPRRPRRPRLHRLGRHRGQAAAGGSPASRPVNPESRSGFARINLMSQTDELLKNNEAYASNFDKGDLAAPAGQEGRRRRLHGRPPRPGYGALGLRRATPT